MALTIDNLDSGSDKPKQARADLRDIAQRVIDISTGAGANQGAALVKYGSSTVSQKLDDLQDAVDSGAAAATSAAAAAASATSASTSAADAAASSATATSSASSAVTAKNEAVAAATGLSIGGVVGKATKALLDADLAYAADRVGLVTNDTTAANNGFYRKTGASGAGAWVQASFDRVALLESEVDAATSTLVFGASNLSTALGIESFGRFAGGVSSATNSVVAGHQAGGSMSSAASRVVYIGRAAARGNISGVDNTEIGYAASLLKSGGSERTVIGANAQGNSSGSNSNVTAIGAGTLANATANDACAGGRGAGAAVTSAIRFTAFGTGAATGHTTEASCTFIGWGSGSGSGQTFGHSNQTAIGANSVCDWENQVSLGNADVKELRLFGKPWARSYAFADTVIGDDAGNRDATAGSGGRVIIGYGAGTASLGANDNLSVIIGYLACNAAVGNRAWVAIGDKAGQYAQNTIDCTVAGSQAGRNLGRHTPVYDAIADQTHVEAAGLDTTHGLPLPANIVGATGFGKNALRHNTIGQNNTGFGDSALGFTTVGKQNTAIGYVCGEGNVIGSFNTLAGQGVRAFMRSGDHNALLGYGIGSGVGAFGDYPAGGSFNSLLGSEAARSWAGGDLAGVGYRVFYNLTGGTGGDVGVGRNAGRSVVTGGKNIFIGDNAGFHASQATSVQNSIVIGKDCFSTASNQVVIGDASHAEFKLGDVSFTAAQIAALKALVA